MNYTSKLFQETYKLRERTFSFNLDPNDRSWFVSPFGDLWADVSHRLICKHKFPDDWKKLKDKDLSDGDIEEIFTNRLLQSGWVKIGELSQIYAVALKLTQTTKDILQGWASGWLKVTKRDEGINIHIIREDNDINMMLSEISADALFEF